MDTGCRTKNEQMHIKLHIATLSPPKPSCTDTLPAIKCNTRLLLICLSQTCDTKAIAAYLCTSLETQRSPQRAPQYSTCHFQLVPQREPLQPGERWELITEFLFAPSFEIQIRRLCFTSSVLDVPIGNHATPVWSRRAQSSVSWINHSSGLTVPEASLQSHPRLLVCFSFLIEFFSLYLFTYPTPQPLST